MYKWDPTWIAVYREQLNSTSSMNLFERLLCKIADCDCDQKTAIDIFNDYISTAIGQHFQKKVIHTSNFSYNNWFDDECKIAKRILHDKGKTCNLLKKVLGPATRFKWLQTKCKRDR